jgi:hypothetical protein
MKPPSSRVILDVTTELLIPISVYALLRNFACPRTIMIPRSDKASPDWGGLVKLWHPSTNLPLEPAEVSYKSSQDAWWRCANSADHVWQERVRKVVTIWEKGANPCPHCADRKTESISLQTLYPEVAKQWDVEKNLPLEPSKITYGSRIYVWWRCPKFPDDHFWRATVRNVVNCYKDGNTGCPFCSGRRKIESDQ